jgi:hypothetical protein
MVGHGACPCFCLNIKIKNAHPREYTLGVFTKVGVVAWFMLDAAVPLCCTTMVQNSGKAPRWPQLWGAWSMLSLAVAESVPVRNLELQIAWSVQGLGIKSRVAFSL